ncbi:hypothetical protein MLD38_024272 [Melastoma candidum]|uniref:Uncharacterized protein n=1 Tax=Melastoma candidum TaxID=119954 RepID=A0ACB9NSS3_9MYRT|nr:hypothetical protein MLD38_024272 [Melastoma candidum]
MECLPFSVIPTVPAKAVPKPVMGNSGTMANGCSRFPSPSPSSSSAEGEEGETMVESFCLGDFWKAYAEWSAYGVGVPIMLPDGDCVVQYYFPSLSAMQIFTYKRMAGESSSLDSESDTDGSRSRMEISSNDSDYSFGGMDVEDLGELYCQYNEILNPYARLPLTEKIKELAQKYQGLTTLYSTELTPHSWVSIAWYPILQIPVMRNQKELSASFLTYHRLSWSPQGLMSVIPNKYLRRECVSPRKMESDLMMNGQKEIEIEVPPFAMNTYKMYGKFWIDPMTGDWQMMQSYQKAAQFWLKEHRFLHHDYNFFVSRGI